MPHGQNLDFGAFVSCSGSVSVGNNLSTLGLDNNPND